ncbi:MAG: hypothetical protein ACKVOR_11350 [Flavobacteriales bacterium]
MYAYPQYRKLSNSKSLYKIESADTLIELQLLGSRWVKHKLHARILPERLLISDLLSCSTAGYVYSDVHEFELALHTL